MTFAEILAAIDGLLLAGKAVGEALAFYSGLAAKMNAGQDPTEEDLAAAKAHQAAVESAWAEQLKRARG